VDTKVCEHAAQGTTPCKELQASYYSANSDESESTKPNFVDYMRDIKKHFFTIKEGEYSNFAINASRIRSSNT
jgi:hypothetical protein